jgi:hypothetical protein
MLAFFLSPIGRYVATAIAAFAIIGGLYGYMRVHYYNAGWAAAIHAVAAQDQKAIDATHEALATVKACRDSGRTWDVANGVCG